MGKKIVSIILTICVLLSSNIFSINTNAEEINDESNVMQEVSTVTNDDLDIVTLKKDTIYRFENTTKEVINLKPQENTDAALDYKVHNPGEWKGIRRLDYDSDFVGARVDVGATIDIQVRNADTNFYMPKEVQDTLVEIDTPVVEIIKLNKNETLRYEDIGGPIAFDTSASIDNNLRYVSKGTILGSTSTEEWWYDRYKGIMTYSNDIEEYQVMKGDTIEFYVPYEYKDNYKIVNSKIVEEIQIDAGQAYEIRYEEGKNKTYTTAYIDKQIGEDMTYYALNGKNIVYIFEMEYKYNDFFIAYGDIFRFKVDSKESRTIYLPYELKDSITKIDDMKIDEIEIKDKNTLEFTSGINNYRTVWLYSTKENSQCEIEILNPDGSYNYSSTVNEKGKFRIDNGQSIKITPKNGSEYKVYAVNDSVYNEFEIEDVNRDKKVDILDLSLVASMYNVKYSSFKAEDNNGEISAKEIIYDNRFDMNDDGIIDLYDLVMIGKKM